MFFLFMLLVFIPTIEEFASNNFKQSCTNISGVDHKAHLCLYYNNAETAVVIYVYHKQHSYSIQPGILHFCFCLIHLSTADRWARQQHVAKTNSRFHCSNFQLTALILKPTTLLFCFALSTSIVLFSAAADICFQRKRIKCPCQALKYTQTVTD